MQFNSKALCSNRLASRFRDATILSNCSVLTFAGLRGAFRFFFMPQTTFPSWTNTAHPLFCFRSAKRSATQRIPLHAPRRALQESNQAAPESGSNLIGPAKYSRYSERPINIANMLRDNIVCEARLQPFFAKVIKLIHIRKNPIL